MNVLDIMDGIHVNQKFDAIMKNKTRELEELANSKRGTRKMTDVTEKEHAKDGLTFSVKATLAKIHAEQERKLKSSKAYKKKEQCNVVSQDNPGTSEER